MPGFRRKHQKLLIWTIVGTLLFNFGVIAQNAREYQIEGSVIDERGKPVANAWVIVVPSEPPTEIDQLLDGVRTNGEGKFSIRYSVPMGKVIGLNIIPRLKIDGFNMFDVPYGNYLANNSPGLTPRSLKFGRNLRPNVGRIRFAPNFVTVNVELDLKSRPQGSTEFEFWAVIFDKRGRQLDEVNFGVLGNAGAINDGILTLAVPKGSWRIKTCADPFCNKTIGTTEVFSVNGTPLFLKTRIIGSRTRP